MTEVSERRDGICGAHEALAVGICPRCGDNVCSACLDASSALPDHCAACRDRVGAARMPWEEAGGSWARRWGRQTKKRQKPLTQLGTAQASVATHSASL